MDARLEKYLHQLNENDLVKTAQEQLSELSDELGVESSLLEKVARLSQQVEELQAEKQRMLDEGSQRSFPSDREARLMKTRNGFLPAYNVQSVVDSRHHLIGAMQVTDHPNDFEDLQPSIHAMQEELQVEVARAVADTGYANEEQILALEEEGKVIAVPFNEGDHSPKEDRERGIFFTYDADNDYYICSQEKILPIKDRQVRKHGKLYRKYQGRDCKGCPLIKFCTTSKKGRIIYRRADAEPIRQYVKKCKEKHG
ncbi:transposase [Bacteroides sp.]|uniref:transposase n=1 Tax=Bacteroides sp. TaxID=29523 RepID=UPI00257A7681|nr:transposase [Bacteroides sp.]